MLEPDCAGLKPAITHRGTGTDPKQLCSRVGCRSGATINVSLGAEPVGTWQFAGMIDGDAFECTALFHSGTGVETSCNHSQVSMKAFHSSAQGGALTIELDATPCTAELIVSRDENRIVSKTIGFAYEQYEPNGRECGPICLGASAEIDASVKP